MRQRLGEFQPGADLVRQLRAHAETGRRQGGAASHAGEESDALRVSEYTAGKERVVASDNR